MANPILDSANERMGKAADVLRRELGNIRAGVANPAILRNVTAEDYGAETPLNHLASITVPEARVLLITPFDKSILKDIEQAIFASDLGLTPANDGSVIRLVIPALTEETRKSLAKDCLLYTSDAADEEDSVDLGGRSILKKKNKNIKKKKRRTSNNT